MNLINKVCTKKGTSPPPPTHSPRHHRAPSTLNHLTRRTSRHVRALGALLAPSNSHAAPLPARARPLAAQKVDWCRAARNGALDSIQSQISDRHACRGGTRRASILVILLNHNAVLGDVGERDVAVRHIVYLASSAVYSLDAHTILRVGNGGVFYYDTVDCVVRAATDGADREAVATGAGAAGEVNVCAGVDGEAVVLVLDVRVGDCDSR